MLHAVRSIGPIVNNVGMPVGEDWLDRVLYNAICLDASSFRAPPPTPSTVARVAYQGQNGERVWWGAFEYKTGMTTLVVEGWAQRHASEKIAVFVNGSKKVEATAPNGDNFSLSWTISGMADGDIGEVDIQILGTGWNTAGVRYIIYDAYVTPIVIGRTWVTPPTFAGTYDAGDAADVVAMEQYLFDRINAVPIMPDLAHLYAFGTSVTGATCVVWYGAVERANGNNTFSTLIRYMNLGNVAEYFRIRIGGTTIYTSDTYTVGDTVDFDLNIDISSFPENQRLELVIESITTTGPPGGADGAKNTRWHVFYVKTTQEAPDVSVTPVESTANELVTSSTLDGRLNALVTMLSGIKTRIDDNPRIFNRARVHRRCYGRGPVNYAVFVPAKTFSHRFIRQGSRLVVYGKNLKLGWGAVTTKADNTVTQQYQSEFAHNETLTEGDKVQKREINLNSIPELNRGQAYYVYGDASLYVAEYLV